MTGQVSFRTGCTHSDKIVEYDAHAIAVIFSLLEISYLLQRVSEATDNHADLVLRCFRPLPQRRLKPLELT